MYLIASCEHRQNLMFHNHVKVYTCFFTLCAQGFHNFPVFQRGKAKQIQKAKN